MRRSRQLLQHPCQCTHSTQLGTLTRLAVAMAQGGVEAGAHAAGKEESGLYGAAQAAAARRCFSHICCHYVQLAVGRAGVLRVPARLVRAARRPARRGRQLRAWRQVQAKGGRTQRRDVLLLELREEGPRGRQLQQAAAWRGRSTQQEAVWRRRRRGCGCWWRRLTRRSEGTASSCSASRTSGLPAGIQHVEGAQGLCKGASRCGQDPAGAAAATSTGAAFGGPLSRRICRPPLHLRSADAGRRSERAVEKNEVGWGASRLCLQRAQPMPDQSGWR